MASHASAASTETAATAQAAVRLGVLDDGLVSGGAATRAAAAAGAVKGAFGFVTTSEPAAGVRSMMRASMRTTVGSAQLRHIPRTVDAGSGGRHMPLGAAGRGQLAQGIPLPTSNHHASPVKLPNASAVEAMMMRATLPLSAP